ncbi:TonB-dependent receptor domain-containing protein [Tsuneonella sp. HG222]
MVISRPAVSLLACACAMLSASVRAQDDEIVVTGTLIRGSAEDAPAPVEVIGRDELDARGGPTAMDLSKALAVSSGVLGDASQFDTRSQFNQGAASVNLRGLGPQRTLVLLNGKRIVATGAGNLPLVDINLLPLAALDRIEILKDGAAATYGSDAIAGVMNFITKNHRNGFEFGADYRWIDGSAGDWTAGLSWGGDIGPARVFVSGGWQKRGELRTTDRDWGILPYAANPQGGYSGGGNPGNFDFNGALGGFSFTADQGCTALGGFRSLPGSAGDLCQTSYLGFTNLVEPEERWQAFADIALPVGGGEIRLSGLYGRSETMLTTSPSYLPTIAPSTSAAFGGQGLFVIPQYAPALRDYCSRFGAAAGCALDAAGAPQQPALAFPVRFRPVLLGGNPLYANDRGAATPQYEAAQYQFAASYDRPLSDAIDLSAGLTYSANDRRFQGIDSYVDLLQNALAGFGGESCAYASPQARAGLSAAQLAAVAGTGGCHFFNPFSTAIAANAVTGQTNPGYAGTANPLGLSLLPGAGLINDASTLDDFFVTIQRGAFTRQWVADLQVSGDAGFALPGGEVRFALGAQYRDDRYRRTYSDNHNLDLLPCPGSVLDPGATCAVRTGAIGFLGSGVDTAVSEDVWALFGELQLPVTDRLQAQLSARYEDYGGRIGATFDPQLRLKWQATDWLAFRGGAGTTFRGPPPQNTAADLVILTFIGGAFRAVDIFANPDLTPETATTYNAGVLLDRGGLRASVDYWRYDFSGAIESEPINGMVAALFGASGTANCADPAYAGLRARFTFSGGVCAAGNVQRLATYAFNSADVSTSGLDFRASYDFRLADQALQVGLNGSHVFDYRVGDVAVEGILVQPAFDAAGKLNFQTTAYPIPRWKGQAWLQGRSGDHLVRLQANHVAGYTDQRGADVFGPNTASLAGASVTAGKRIGSFTTLDAIWRWSVLEKATLTLALENLLDADPPFARLDQNYDPFTASPLGFTAKIGASIGF